MQLEHEFTVPVPASQAWPALVDIDRIAPCMPDATITKVDGGGFEGRLKVKIGPITVTYGGTVSLLEKDESARRAVIEARGRETRGSGTATAQVTAQLHDEGDATRVTVNTNLFITGKPAQFSRGVMSDVGGNLLRRFADCLSGQLALTHAAASADEASTGPDDLELDTALPLARGWTAETSGAARSTRNGLSIESASTGTHNTSETPLNLQGGRSSPGQEPSRPGQRNQESVVSLPRLFDPGLGADSGTTAYVYDEDTVLAVNQALVTGRPLLVTGPPGTGKSSLARSVAQHLGWRYFEYMLTPRTRSTELLWHLDEYRRINDAQLGKLGSADDYIQRAVLWEAFENAEPRAVVLLDHIDRADDEVADTLIDVLGSLSFVVTETGKRVLVRGDMRPLVVVTSAEERQLPLRFSRRCVELVLRYPSTEQLYRIAMAHGLVDDEARIEQLTDQFMEAQHAAWNDNLAPPTTADYLDAVTAIESLDLGPDAMLRWIHSFFRGREYDMSPAAKRRGLQLGVARRTPSSLASRNRRLRVFLCHSSGDKLAVRQLYERLASDGLQPWLDEEDILPGADWDREIREAVRRADLVVVCLSMASITKSGYVQREIRYALDIAEEKPEDQIYIVPARLEPCEVPDRLRRYQWVNLYDPDGYDRLLSTTGSIASKV